MDNVKRLRPECISCIVKGNLEKFPANTSIEKQVEYKQKLLQIIGNARDDLSSPVISKKIKQLQSEMFGMVDDYKEIKHHFNELMMEFETSTIKDVEQSKEPLYRAISYAMIGNYIDFGAMDSVDETYLKELLSTASERTFDLKQYSQLEKDLRNAKKVVYITDNCGEIVMDKVLVQTIQKLYPQANVQVLVRGYPVINDATIDDARQVGMDTIASIVENGSDIPGTFYDYISQEAKELLDTADVILAKGQGNFETMRMCQKNVYYIFLCKCEMFARQFDVPRFTGILMNDKEVCRRCL